MGGEKVKLQLNQMDLILAITKEVEKQAKAQKAGKVMLIPRQFNAIISAANSVVDAFGRAEVKATPQMGLTAWLASDDTGMSSKTMAAHLFGSHHDKRDYSHPHDPDDFGRCYRFIEAVPGAIDRLPKMAELSPVWQQLVTNWDKLTAMYLAALVKLDAGMEPDREMYDFMKSLGC